MSEDCRNCNGECNCDVEETVEERSMIEAEEAALVFDEKGGIAMHIPKRESYTYESDAHIFMVVALGNAIRDGDPDLLKCLDKYHEKLWAEAQEMEGEDEQGLDE